MTMLEVNGLVKNFRHFSLGPVNLSLENGCAMGLVGANGAGKTTLFRSLIGTLRRNQGTVRVNGLEASAVSGVWRQQIGYIGDFTPLFNHWSGARNLAAFSRFYPNWSKQRATDLANRLNLDLKQSAKNYSTGQRTKLAIVIALAHSPHLLLLDEPSTGLDPVSREAFMDLLFEQVGSEQVSMLYATHHISEIEQLADRLVFVSGGQIIRNEVKEDLSENWRRLSFRCENDLGQIPHVMEKRSEHHQYDLISDNANASIQYLNNKGVADIESSRLSIEKIAVQILKNSAMENGDV
ncbi:MAG: ABC transporter ATP-binding protein [Gammaproteobacteria bacterium]|nr:ABC transporter ATP-binding protein [Gammaproteobacteria bacterium]